MYHKNNITVSLGKHKMHENQILPSRGRFVNLVKKSNSKHWND